MSNVEEMGQISPAKQAEIAQKAVHNHARALQELSHEIPAASRTEADEAELGRLLLEGQNLRQRANQATANALQTPPVEHQIDEVDNMVITPKDHAKGIEHSTTAGHINE